MYVRLNVGRVVKKKIEHIVDFMFVDANDLSFNRNMIDHQAERDDHFLQAEIFWGMA